MGIIWLQTSNGSRIHMPVVGADVNTPDTAIPVSAASTLLQNRCLSGAVQVVHPTFGTITFDFAPAGRTGSCIQCGQCCTHPAVNCVDPAKCGYVNDAVRGIHRCQYLTIHKLQGKDGLGKESGTECSIRNELLDRFKGCLLEPNAQSSIKSWMTSCGFTFG